MQSEYGDCAMTRTEDKCARSAMCSGLKQARCELVNFRHDSARIALRRQWRRHALGGRGAERTCSADTTSGTSAPPVTAATCCSVMPAPCAITSGCAPRPAAHQAVLQAQARRLTGCEHTHMLCGSL